jgi:alanine racemase
MINNRFGRPSYLEIDLEAIAENTRKIKASIPRDITFQAVVKSDAYGHGAVMVSKTVLGHGADYLGVALIEEGIELREAGIKAPIVVLYPEPLERAPLFIEYDLIPTVSDLDFAGRLNEIAEPDRKPDIYLKVDTGMSRYGPDSDELPALIDSISRLKNLRIAGISSNFSAADNGDKTFCFEQLSRFRNAVANLNGIGPLELKASIANSGALLDLPQSYFDMVRVGLLLYGYYPSPENGRTVEVKPAMSLKSRVLYLRDAEAGRPVGYGMSYTTPHRMKIATIPVGYGDGYPRALSNNGEVLIGGRRAPIVGRVCMDALMADVSGIDGVRLGDEVVLLGSQGDDFIGADEIAGRCRTISWEILCGFTPRLPVVYHKKDASEKEIQDVSAVESHHRTD